MLPQHRTMPYRGTKRTIKEMEGAARGPRGAQSLELRLALEDVIRYVKPKDKLSLIVAVYNWFLPRYHFVHDPDDVEQVKDPVRMLREIKLTGIVVGDCDDATTFLMACMRCLGIATKPVRVGFRPPTLAGVEGPFTHVYAVARDQQGTTVVLDPVAAKETTAMLGRVKQARGGFGR